MSRFVPPDITNDGERVSPDVPNALFLAHLSIYRFAGRWAKGAHVLDAGCGTGYGAAWLADHGAASVLGVDIEPEAIAHARRRAVRPTVRFAVADLARIVDVGAPPGGWGLIVSSNALEHVWGVDDFLRGAWTRLAPDGTVVIAVPGVLDDASRVLQMSNRYHLNIWSPEQWRHALARYFADVTAFRHWLDRADVAFDPAFDPTSDPTLDSGVDGLDEADFAFEAMSPDDLRAPTLSHVFVASRPRAPSDVPDAGTPLAFIDTSFSRRPPRITPLPPDEATAGAPVSPAHLPAKALRSWREHGARALFAEARRSVVWRFRRRYALWLLGPRSRGR